MSPFDLQNVSTGQNGTRQCKIEQHKTNIQGIKQILCCMMFGGQMLLWYFRQLVQRTKSCPVVQWGQ
jgi:hypothetical protein